MGRTYEHTERLRYADSDPMGVAHHRTGVLWLESGRVGLLRAGGLPYGELERRGYFLVVRELHLEYFGPVRFDEVVRVVTRVEKVERVWVSMVSEAYRQEGGEKVLAGRVKLACLNREGKLTRLPEELRALLEGETD